VSPTTVVPPRSWPGRSSWLCAQFGVSFRQVDYWCRAGYLGLRLRRGQGSGTQRMFTVDETFRLAVLADVARLLNNANQRPTFPAALTKALPEWTLADAPGIWVIAEGAVTLRVDTWTVADRVRALFEDVAS